MIEKENKTAVRLLCNYCHKEMIGYKDDMGAVKVRCKNCGTITYSKLRINKKELQIIVDLSNISL